LSHCATPSIAVDLFLTVEFAIACRWTKRNPSSFLRYVLFPFGGLNVERWLRFMLVIVRIFAVFGFFAFILTFIDLLAPESVAHPTPAALYSKFALCILISFFALRGTAEPVESYETPQFRTTPTKPSAAPKSAPAAPRSVPAPAKDIPSIPPIPAKPAPTASMPATIAAPNRLADVEAPPVPNRSYPLCAPPPGVVKERLATIGSTFVMGRFLPGSFIFWVSLG
jgi:hypothetical protein